MIGRWTPLALIALAGLFGCAREEAAAVKAGVAAGVAKVKSDRDKEAEKVAAQIGALDQTYTFRGVPADGALTGTVTWAGEIPAPKALNLGGNADKKICEMNGPVMDEFIVVNPKNKGLRDVIVWLDPADKDAKLAIPPALAKSAVAKVELDQPHCAFIPHAMVLRDDQVLVAKNTSTITHNFKWQGLADGNAGNKVLPPGDKIEIKLVAEKMPISIECNLHNWMNGNIKVADHPYIAVTDADGRFSMPAPPAGAVKLKIWHRSNGWLGKSGKGKDVTATGAAQDVGTFAY
jgi:hypothetical protein